MAVGKPKYSVFVKGMIVHKAYFDGKKENRNKRNRIQIAKEYGVAERTIRGWKIQDFHLLYVECRTDPEKRAQLESVVPVMRKRKFRPDTLQQLKEYDLNNKMASMGELAAQAIVLEKELCKNMKRRSLLCLLRRYRMEWTKVDPTDAVIVEDAVVEDVKDTVAGTADDGRSVDPGGGEGGGSVNWNDNDSNGMCEGIDIISNSGSSESGKTGNLKQQRGHALSKAINSDAKQQVLVSCSTPKCVHPPHEKQTDAIVRNTVCIPENSKQQSYTITIDNELVARTLLELANDGIDDEEWDDDYYYFIRMQALLK